MSDNGKECIFANISNATTVFSIAVGAAVLFAADGLGYDGQGRIAAFLAGILILVFSLFRPLWKRTWFHLVFSLIVAVHLAAIVLVHFPAPHYRAMMVTPFAMLDGLVWIAVISIIAKRVRN